MRFFTMLAMMAALMVGVSTITGCGGDGKDKGGTAPKTAAPAKDAPAKDAPAKDAPAKDAPAKDAPAPK